jgi:hypothetical protein
MKNIENELSTLINNYDKLQRDYLMSNEQLNKCRIDLEQTEKSNISHKEQVNRLRNNPNILTSI